MSEMRQAVLDIGLDGDNSTGELHSGGATGVETGCTASHPRLQHYLGWHCREYAQIHLLAATECTWMVASPVTPITMQRC